MVVKIRVPFLVTYYITAPIICGTQKGTIILTTTHMGALRFGVSGAFSKS